MALMETDRGTIIPFGTVKFKNVEVTDTLIVNQTTVQDAQFIVDFTGGEALLVRSDGDSGDTLTVNTQDYWTQFSEGDTGNNKSLTVNPVATQINVHTGGGSGDEPLLFAPSTSIDDNPYGTLRVDLEGVEVLPGTGSDPVTHPLQVNDTNQNKLADFREGDTTVFYNGIDAGPIQAAEDTYQQLIDQNVTSALSAGDQVGYTFAVDNNAVVEVSAEADGSGGTQNEALVVRDAGGTAGTDEVEIRHTGSNTVLNNKGGSAFNFETSGNLTYQFFDNNFVPRGNNPTLGISNDPFQSLYLSTDIRDENDNEYLTVTQNASAVNHVDVANAATGNAPVISAVGDDTDIDLSISGKGSGFVGINTTSPSRQLTVDSGQPIVSTFQNTNATEVGISFQDSNTSSDAHVGIGASGDELTFRAGSNWNVGVFSVSGDFDTSAGTGRQHNRVTVSSAQTLGFDEYVSADTSGGSFTLTLPSVGSEDDGHAIHVKRNGANNLTVDASDSDTVDDGASVSFTSDNEAKTFIYNHSNTDWEEF